MKNSQTMNSKSTQTYRTLTLWEEIVNSITHGIGVFLSIVALVIVLVDLKKHEDLWHLISFFIYGSTLILLYLSSTLFHSFPNQRVKSLFERFDHVSIFLLIAGTYTPVLLTTFRDDIGLTLFGLVWGMVILGLAIRSMYLARFHKLMIGVYLLVALLFVLAGKEIYQNLPPISIVFLLAGGFSYSLGVVLYSRRNSIHSHGIWHLLVLTGSILQFFAVYYSFQ